MSFSSEPPSTPPPPGPPPAAPPPPVPPAGSWDAPSSGSSGGRGAGLAITVGLVVLALVLAGVVGWRVLGDDDPDDPGASGTVDPTPSDLPSTAPDLARFYEQRLRWQECGRTQCTQLTVPLDYEDPDGKSIKLAVLRVPAQERSERRGALVVNPGGPGGSGVQYAAAGSLQFGSELSDHFDIVGFDPRGVASSTPLECLDTEGTDELLAYDPDPDDRAERDGMDDLIRGFGQGCLDESGDLARHMSTQEVVRDMDILRAALGEAKLDYFGASYGTFIGATYAEMFPEHVGRFVLDGAVDPSLSNEELALEQAGGFETALRAYVQACVDRGDCFLGDSVDEGTRRIRTFLDELDRKPLFTDDLKRPLTEGLGMLGIWRPLYATFLWERLDAALEQAFDENRGSKLLALADLYSSRGTDSYLDNSMEVLYAVNCLDHSDSIPTAQVLSRIPAFEEVSPTFGRAFAFSLSTCANWPIKSGQVSKPIAAPGAPPIVVVGTTRDPATPLRWAEALASQLESGRLITRDGDGHTGFQQGNACVDDAIEAFLIDGKDPGEDLNC